MKAILVIDKPDSCEECPLRSYSNLELICTPRRKGASDVACPLMPIEAFEAVREELKKRMEHPERYARR